MTYPTHQQYTFVKIFYETQEEENKAHFLMEGIKNIITKNATKKHVYHCLRNQERYRK